MKLKNDRYLLAVAWVVFGILGRLIPHPPNMTPMTSVALFGGTQLNRGMALLVTVIAMVLSDAAIALVSGHNVFGIWSLFTYSGFAAIVFAGSFLRSSPTFGKTFQFLLGSSVAFWLWTNFGLWATGEFGMYPRTLEGLLACYAAALPFLGSSVVGDLAWGLTLFGTFHWARKLAPKYGFAVQGA